MIEVVELDRLKEAVGERGTSAYVLTVSGTATPHVVQAAVRWVEGLTPTRGVLHRDAPSPDPTSSCTADCVPLLQTVRPATR